MARYMDNTAAMNNNRLAAARMAALGQMAGGGVYRNLPYAPQVSDYDIPSPRRRRTLDVPVGMPPAGAPVGMVRPVGSSLTGAAMRGIGRIPMRNLDLPTPGRIGQGLGRINRGVGRFGQAAGMTNAPSENVMNRLRELLIRRPMGGFNR